MTTEALKVLFVDDEKVSLRALERELEDESYELLLANSGKEALELLVNNEIAVFATDLMMPIIGGHELLNIVKNDYPDTIRIIFSGTSDMIKIKKIMSQGDADIYITKPFKFEEELKPKLAQCLGLYRDKNAIKSLKKVLFITLEKIQDGIFIFNSAGEIRYMNPAGKSLLGNQLENVKKYLLNISQKNGNTKVAFPGEGEAELILELIATNIEWDSERAHIAYLKKKP
jgi:CheY-like chemotaxis protein